MKEYLFSLVKNVDEVKESINKIKSMGEYWNTNFFVRDEKLAYWIEAQQAYIKLNDYTLFILRKRPTYTQMYICNTDDDALKIDLCNFVENCKGTISTDILGENDILVDALKQANFKSYMTLHSYVQNYVSTPVKPDKIDDKWFAKEVDLDGIMEILYENMDPLCEQIPDREEMLQDIKDHNVLVIHSPKTGELAAFLAFHRYGKLLHWEYWASRKKYRKDKLGLKLYEPYMQLNYDVRRHFGFVRDDNPMMEVYKYMGFRFELKDEVFVREGIKET